MARRSQVRHNQTIIGFDYQHAEKFRTMAPPQ